jgi:phosphatidylethanolamine-binding protein (PEBP) family uncharacterized protein
MEPRLSTMAPLSTILASSFHKKEAQKTVNLITVSETTPEPTFSITSERDYDPATAKYTLIMVDPDATGTTVSILADSLHWIVADVQPKCITMQQRKQVAMYMFPTSLSVNPHTYVFLVYRQPPNYVPPPSLDYLPGARAKFDLAAYVKQAKLIGPVGDNYYREGQEQNVYLLLAGHTQDGTGYVG